MIYDFQQFSALTLPLSILLAFALDLCLGDPESWPHPVRLIALVVRKFEVLLYPAKLEPRAALARGCLLALTIPAAFALIVLYLQKLLFDINPWLYTVLRIIAIYQLIACKSMIVEAKAVQDVLQLAGVPAARKQVGRIVGRDTGQLSGQEIIAACVESVAESFNDGVFAPLFYLALGGLPLMIFYKTVNTLDSLIAYRSPRYLYFGRCAAYQDDILNYLPARLAALCLLGAAAMLRLEPARAWRIFRRDRRKHSSPNSGQSEAVVAGALGVQLGGTHCYGGQPQVKPYLGDKLRQLELQDIARTNRIFSLASGLACFLLVALAWVRQGVFL